MIKIVPRIGTGGPEDRYRPDTEAESWRVIEERESDFVIEILE